MFWKKGKCLIACFSPSFSVLLFLPLLQNSIRHNLSLHSRFVRVQNEGTGKSSWWMLNPEGGKSGKSPRRRAASMDNNSKFIKSRGRAAKKKVNICLCSLFFSDSALFRQHFMKGGVECWLSWKHSYWILVIFWPSCFFLVLKAMLQLTCHFLNFLD